MHAQTYFLGANTAFGFHSCYDTFCRPTDGNFLFVIKGGPGCGKSSFMRKIGRAAEDAGLQVEYVLCSGDPDSIDGVYIPERKLGYVDGTAPHTLDVPYPGACGAYLDLGQFYDCTDLKSKADSIMQLNAEYKNMYRKAYAILRSFVSQKPDHNRKANNQLRFHTAISCQGVCSTLPSCSAELVTETELRHLIQNAEDTDIFYLHPLWPSQIVGVYCTKKDIFYYTEMDLPSCSTAVSVLKEAKKLHDALEEIYNPYVDFDGVYKTAAEHIAKYL